MSSNHDANRALVFTYLQQRKTIGILGMVLPIGVYFIARLCCDTPLQDSISAYYKTPARDFFVGILIAISAFMLAYNGPAGADRKVGWLASLTAVSMVAFPTQPVGTHLDELTLAGTLHMLSAFTFFSSLIYFCLVLFVKTDPQKQPSPQKFKRNRVYRLSGYTMALCLVLISLLEVSDTLLLPIARYQPVFWLEGLAIWAFGLAWLTKGEAILRDAQD